MKVLKKYLDEGKVTVLAETLDDLWHLEKVIEPGDVVSGNSWRRLQVKGRDQQQEKKPAFLSIEVVQVELHKFSNTLRVLGTIMEGKPEELCPKGSHHTIEIVPGTKVLVWKKEWKNYLLDRLAKAEKESKMPRISVVCVDDEQAVFAYLTAAGAETAFSVSSGRAGKKYGEKEKTAGKKEYYEEVFAKLQSLPTDKVIIAGPGFEPENLKKWISQKQKAFLAKCLFGKTSNSGEQGVEEVLKKGLVEQLSRENEAAKQALLLEELLKRIAKEGNASYGPKQVTRAVEQGAVDDLLVTDKYLRENKEALEGVLDAAEKSKARVHVISVENNSGKQLQGLGGIAALLRFKVGE